MKWLIYGSKGWIGGMVINYIKNNLPEEVVYEG